jgi:hypothetical protein
LTVDKTEEEIIPLAVNFVQQLARLPGSQTIVDGSVKAYDSQKEDVSAAMVQESTISPTRIDSIIKGGIHSNRYSIVFIAQTTDYKLTEIIFLNIKQFNQS